VPDVVDPTERFDELDPVVQEMAQQLAKLLAAGLGTRSKWALRSATDAAQTNGISGMIAIQIPVKAGDRCEINFTCGVVELISRWGG
jgi:hypothetical protein